MLRLLDPYVSVRSVLVGFVLLLFFGGSDSRALSQEPPSPNRPAIATEERILQDDVLEIRMAGWSLNPSVRIVDETGTFQFLFVDHPVGVACKTATQLAEELKQAYSKYLIDPRVTVVIREQPSRFVVVKGAVKQASRFDLRRQATADELITLAGGATEFFSGRLTVVRPVGWTCEGDQVRRYGAEHAILTAVANGTGIIPGDFRMRPGMTVELEAKPQVFVVGNVVRPQVVVLSPSLTVTQAIAMAGGTLPDTLEQKVRILRVQAHTADRRTIWVDLKAKAKGKAADPLLEADDILEVPSRGGHGFHQGAFPLAYPIQMLPLTVIE
jgi:polysaccharide export outer membrane protein